MSGDQLDLDAIEFRAGEAWRTTPLSDDVLALVAEVRRLRALELELLEAAAEWMRLGSVDGSDAQRTIWEAGSDLHYLLTAKPGEFTRAALDPT